MKYFNNVGWVQGPIVEARMLREGGTEDSMWSPNPEVDKIRKKIGYAPVGYGIAAGAALGALVPGPEKAYAAVGGGAIGALIGNAVLQTQAHKKYYQDHGAKTSYFGRITALDDKAVKKYLTPKYGGQYE
jgi:hypothetical protein